MCPRPSYMIEPRGSPPRGESISSPSARWMFQDTSCHVPESCSVAERGAGWSGATRAGAAMRWGAAAAATVMESLMSDLAAGRPGAVTTRSAGAAAGRAGRACANSPSASRMASPIAATLRPMA